jgi:ribulose-bisphosphate carboxylase large chain
MPAKRKPKPSQPSCDWKHPAKSRTDNTDRILRHRENFTWTGVKTERYKSTEGAWAAISRTVLIGNRGESAKFHLRYFEIAPGGFSSLEQHRHEHVVICVRGKGRVVMGRRKQTLHYLDTAYLAPDTVHQLSNPFDEPFGFLCIVNARRDRPRTVRQK